jgi:hypothetical protein
MTHRLSLWAERRSAPVVATVLMVIGVMAFSLLGQRLLHGGGAFKLLSPSDLWSMSTASRAILHGHFSHIYVPGNALTSPPAFEFLLVPVLAFGELLGLSPHQHGTGQAMSMWFVLGPVAALLASTPLFALDAVARSWRWSERRRLALALVGAFGVANLAVAWGHPEDCVAVALVVWAALAMEHGGDAAAPRAAWLLGAGIAFQPLAVIGLAPVLARLGWRGAARQWWRVALPPAAVLVPALLAEPHGTLFVLWHQPFAPRFNSLTPLSHLAPAIGPGLDGGGPTRLVATLLGAALAVWVCHRRHDLPTVLGITAVAFFVRVALETEFNWYYLWPVPALCLLLSLRRSNLRFAVCSVALLASIVLGDHRVHRVGPWWVALMATGLAMLASAAPPPRRWVAPSQWRSVRAEVRAGAVECGSMVVPAGVDPHRE